LPIEPLEIIGYLIIPIIVGFANVGGLGGGLVKVPVLVILINYS
jgi:hypothetical protein